MKNKTNQRTKEVKVRLTEGELARINGKPASRPAASGSTASAPSGKPAFSARSASSTQCLPARRKKRRGTVWVVLTLVLIVVVLNVVVPLVSSLGPILAGYRGAMEDFQGSIGAFRKEPEEDPWLAE